MLSETQQACILTIYKLKRLYLVSFSMLAALLSSLTTFKLADFQLYIHAMLHVNE